MTAAANGMGASAVRTDSNLPTLEKSRGGEFFWPGQCRVRLAATSFDSSIRHFMSMKSR